MGLFGSLFNKKICAICGGEIGMLGNRKLEDGNMCKDCAALLSPFMTDRRTSTVAEIQQHLAYRQENARLIAFLNPTRAMGTNTKVYLDENAGKFVVTRMNDWRQGNPDIIDISQVTACRTIIRESRRELYHRTPDGRDERFNPPRYEYSYQFDMELMINSPWFNEIHFQLSDRTAHDRYGDEYRAFAQMADEIGLLLCPQGYIPVYHPEEYVRPAVVVPPIISRPAPVPPRPAPVPPRPAAPNPAPVSPRPAASNPAPAPTRPAAPNPAPAPSRPAAPNSAQMPQNRPGNAPQGRPGANNAPQGSAPKGAPGHGAGRGMK